MQLREDSVTTNITVNLNEKDNLQQSTMHDITQISYELFTWCSSSAEIVKTLLSPDENPPPPFVVRFPLAAEEYAYEKSPPSTKLLPFINVYVDLVGRISSFP